MWLPDIIYKNVPTGYILAGVLVASSDINIVGKAGAILMALMGIIVFQMRTKK